jgi:hypothetical protein
MSVESIAQLGHRIDGDPILRIWEESLDAPAGDGADVWVHGELLSGNLLVVDGRLSAVSPNECIRPSTIATSGLSNGVLKDTRPACR